VLHRKNPFPLSTLIAICALALACAWLVPVLFSSDVYAYAAYGELARLGQNPYAHVANASNDALLVDAVWQWGGPFPICVYGPAFVAVAKLVVAALSPFGTLAQLEGMRAIASAAFLCCVPLAYAAFSGDFCARLRATATIGLNPVAIWCAAEGHNDALALAVVLAGFALARRRNEAIGAAIVALSGLIKLPGTAAAIALGVVDRRARPGAAAGLALVAAFSVPLVRGISTQLAPHARYAPQASLAAMLAPLGYLPALLLTLAAAAAFGVYGVTLLRRNLTEGWICFALGGWMLVPNPYPWYALWLVAVAAIGPATRPGAAAILLSVTSLLRYAPDAVGMPNASLSVILGMLATLPVLVLFLPTTRNLGEPVIISDPHDR
jgi:hypothetical protein